VTLSAAPAASLELAPATASEDRFETDFSGFPARSGALETRAAHADSSTLGLVRLFLGVWLAASALFGLVWGLLGWATGARRIAHQG